MNSFQYAGKTFTPVKTLTKKQSEFMTVSKHLKSDRELNLSTYAGTYTWEGFYKNCSDKDFDLFKCEENGKIYIPCENELFEYK